jgi:hypothetical protein
MNRTVLADEMSVNYGQIFLQEFAIFFNVGDFWAEYNFSSAWHMRCSVIFHSFYIR